MTHVLVVDDEPQLLRTMELALRSRGYDVSALSTGAAVLARIANSRPDVILLDLGLPDVDGLEVIRTVHPQHPTLPIIVLSARATSHDKVTALDDGAVDYVTKPFEMNELLARLHAAERRANILAAVTTATLGPIHIDITERSARRTDGVTPDQLHFTPTEWTLLELLLSNPGQLLTTHALLTALRRDPKHTDSSYLRIYLSQLRRKLEPNPERPRYLQTEPGMGYRYQP